MLKHIVKTRTKYSYDTCEYYYKALLGDLVCDEVDKAIKLNFLFSYDMQNYKQYVYYVINSDLECSGIFQLSIYNGQCVPSKSFVCCRYLTMSKLQMQMHKRKATFNVGGVGRGIYKAVYLYTQFLQQTLSKVSFCKFINSYVFESEYNSLSKSPYRYVDVYSHRIQNYEDRLLSFKPPSIYNNFSSFLKDRDSFMLMNEEYYDIHNYDLFYNMIDRQCGDVSGTTAQYLYSYADVNDDLNYHCIALFVVGRNGCEYILILTIKDTGYNFLVEHMQYVEDFDFLHPHSIVYDDVIVSIVDVWKYIAKSELSHLTIEEFIAHDDFLELMRYERLINY
ncbi:hypothetical protein [Pseudomonas orientalis]|nr:hypothetical protein [Pseudomonas orientalis]